ncbi:MAG TPA: plastocyanin/azurin family copper-binding protein [Thermoanaerobaculia bacterium]
MYRSIRSMLFVFLLAAGTAAAATHDVEVIDNSFAPSLLTISVGDSVRWTNTGNFPHNVKADNNSFRSGNASSGAWTFTHTFTTAGEFRYFCELHGAPGGIGMSGMIMVQANAEPPGDANVVFLPVAGSVRGGNNSFFRTFARVFNPSATASVEVGAAFLPAGQSNAAAPEVTFTLAPREVKIYEDIVGVLLGGSGLGAIRFHAAAPFEVTARIFTDSNCPTPAGGTYGQFLRGAGGSEALTKGVLLNLEISPAFRTNIGFANPGTSDVTVTATLMGPGGAVAGPTSIPLLPRGTLSPTALQTVFNNAALSEKNLYLVFEAPQPVFAYAASVDNVTTDSVFIGARPLQ